jgi:hypothetical protein
VDVAKDDVFTGAVLRSGPLGAHRD